MLESWCLLADNNSKLLMDIFSSLNLRFDTILTVFHYFYKYTWKESVSCFLKHNLELNYFNSH